MLIPYLPDDPDDPSGIVDQVLRVGGHHFGACCCCERADTPANPVQNILMLRRKLPVPSVQKWGCVVCKPVGDGACAVLCDECFNTRAAIKYVVVNDGRLPLSACTEDFRHDRRKHEPSRRQLEGLMAARDRRN